MKHCCDSAHLWLALYQNERIISFLFKSTFSPTFLLLFEYANCVHWRNFDDYFTWFVTLFSAADDLCRYDEALCNSLVQIVCKSVGRELLVRFIVCFLLDSNQASVRWQAHALVLHIYRCLTSYWLHTYRCLTFYWYNSIQIFFQSLPHYCYCCFRTYTGV